MFLTTQRTADKIEDQDSLELSQIIANKIEKDQTKSTMNHSFTMESLDQVRMEFPSGNGTSEEIADLKQQLSDVSAKIDTITKLVETLVSSFEKTNRNNVLHTTTYNSNAIHGPGSRPLPVPLASRHIESNQSDPEKK